MKIQVNTTGVFEAGQTLEIIGTGNEIVGRGVNGDPSLTVLRTDGVTEGVTSVIPAASGTLDGLSTGLELLEAEPKLAVEGHRIKATVVEKVSEKPFINIYSVEVVVGVKKREVEDVITVNKTVIELMIKGGMLAHEAKIDVLRDYNDDKEVVVQIKHGHTGEPSVVYANALYDTAGAILSAGEIDFKEGQRETLMTLLSQIPTLDATVFATGDNGYQARILMDTDTYDAILSGEKIANMEDVLQEIHQTVGTPMDTLEDIYNVYKSLNISNKLIVRLLGKIKPYDESVAGYIPSKPQTMFKNKGTVLQRLFAYVLGGESVLLSGDASTGKDLAITTIAYLLQKPLRSHIITSFTDNHDLTGRIGLQAQEEGGGTFVRDSFLVEMMKHGGIVHLAEINVSNPAVMTVLNPIIEKGQKTIDIESSGERVIAHEDFLFYGSMNPGYAGTSEMNWATDSRTPTVDFGKNEDIYDLLKIHHESKDAPEEMIVQVNQVYRSLFDTVQDRRLTPKVLAFRRYASAVYYASEGLMSLTEALYDNVVSKAREDERDTVIDIIDSYIG